MSTDNLPPKKYDWLRPWVETLFILNMFIADSFIGVAIVTAAHFAQLGIRRVEGSNQGCPDFSHPTMSDFMRYADVVVIVSVVGFLAFRFVKRVIKDAS